MVVLTDPNQGSRRGKLRSGKFRYHEVLLEASYLTNDQHRSSDLVLSDYHLAPSFRTASILLDPSGHLTALRAIVSRDYAKRQWVRRRCANARDRVLGHLRSIQEGIPLHDLVIACLFGAGITSHVLLVAGLRNPTVRARYVAVRELLADYGDVEFYETLLELLGTTRIRRGRVGQHLATLADVFDTATKAIKTPFPFASDLSDIARPIAIRREPGTYRARLPSGSDVLDRRHPFQMSEGALGRRDSRTAARPQRQLSRSGGRPRHRFTCRRSATLGRGRAF